MHRPSLVVFFTRSLLVCAFLAMGCGGGGGASEQGTSAQAASNRSTQSANNGGSASGAQNGQQIRAGFLEGCREECFRGGVLTDCHGYCDCMYERMEADGFERRAEQLTQRPDSVTTDPFFQASLAACGPQAIEAGFVNGCASNDPALRPMCMCMLGRLCEGLTHEGCAMWIFQNPSFGDTPAETAQLERIAGLCTGAGR